MIHYSATLLFRPKRMADIKPPELEPYPKKTEREEQVLAQRLVERWSKLEPAARLRALTATARGVWRGPSPLAQDLQAWSDIQKKYGRPVSFQILLRAANLPSRMITGLHLVESVVTSPETWIAVWTGQEWERFHPETGEIFEKSMHFLPLTVGEVPAIQVFQGELPEVRWNISQQILSQWRIHFERIIRSSRFLDRWSLFRLPDQFQETFRILILVPVGALIICVLRNIIGFPTFGIFMPVLMALAFRNTGLLYRAWDICRGRPHRVCGSAMDRPAPPPARSASLCPSDPGHHCLYRLSLGWEQARIEGIHGCGPASFCDPHHDHRTLFRPHRRGRGRCRSSNRCRKCCRCCHHL